jgi:hypothetical protein
MRRKFWSENLKGRDHLDDICIDGRIILECVFEKEREWKWSEDGGSMDL